MTTLLTATVPTPFGSLAIVAEDDVVVASGFMPLDMVLERLPGEYKTKPAGPKTPMPAREAVRAWAAGDLAALDTVKVRQPGGAFRQACWDAMRQVPAGQTVTYAELAETAGNPKAARAAGTACSSNMVAPFVPCHRVVSSSGGFGGYAWGVQLKKAMLAHERGE